MSTEMLERCREFGENRIGVAERAATREDWETLWNEPAHPYTFAWGDCWKQCVEYRVADFPAEVGFFIDVLGLECNALGPDFAMLTGPGGEFFVSIKPASEDGATPSNAIRLQFMLSNIVEAAEELTQRGIVFQQPVAPCAEGSPMLTGHFRTPHGIAVDLWGLRPMVDG